MRNNLSITCLTQLQNQIFNQYFYFYLLPIYFQIQFFRFMRGRAKHQDWSKPFKMIFSKAQFDDLQTSDDTVINIVQKEPVAIQKQQIITPHYETVKRHTEIKPFAKITPNYLRLSPNLNVPKTNDYELTEVDHVFIQTHRQKFKLNGKVVLTTQFLKTIIIALQSKQGKDPIIPRNKNALVNFMEKEYKQLSKMLNYDNFVDLLNNYWRSRRQELKFPLYRPLWRPNHDEYNHLLAFKFREKQKRSLRRSSRTSQDDILEEMAQELAAALKVSERVEMRQQLKQKQLEVQLSLFHQQLKSVFPQPDFLTDSNQQSRNKDRQKVKRLSQQVEKIRRDRDVKTEEVKQPEPTIFDQKESVVNFLATVVYEAELCGLSYEKLFHYKSEAPVHQIPVIGSPSKEIPSVEVEEQEILNMTLRKAGKYILRRFQQDQDESQDSSMIQSQDAQRQEHPKHYFDDLFDYKKRLVTRFYFGQDDEGEYQNLRKNIANSFKKFQTSKDSM